MNGFVSHLSTLLWHRPLEFVYECMQWSSHEGKASEKDKAIVLFHSSCSRRTFLLCNAEALGYRLHRVSGRRIDRIDAQCF